MNMIVVFALVSRERQKVSFVKRLMSRALRELRMDGYALDVYLVDDSVMKKNVLSYPAPRNFPRPDLRGKFRPLGDIYLNPSYIERNGEDLSYMAIHGLLHLFGYRHDAKHDTIEMERKEREVLLALGT